MNFSCLRRSCDILLSSSLEIRFPFIRLLVVESSYIIIAIVFFKRPLNVFKLINFKLTATKTDLHY